jgi:hypothetical protein
LIIFFHGWQGIGAPKLLKRLDIDRAAITAAERSSDNSLIVQKFSWGPEAYALIFIVGTIFLSLKTTAPDPQDDIAIAVLIAACGCLLLGYRVYERINRCTLVLRRDARSGNVAILEMRSLFAKTRYFDARKLIFEAPHPGYIVMASFMWGVVVFVLIQFAVSSPPSVFDPSVLDRLFFGLFAILCAAMVMNIFRTKVVLFRCYFSEYEAKYISKRDARRIALAVLGG